jgi:hypothetical protein
MANLPQFGHNKRRKMQAVGQFPQTAIPHEYSTYRKPLLIRRAMCSSNNQPDGAVGNIPQCKMAVRWFLDTARATDRCRHTEYRRRPYVL